MRPTHYFLFLTADGERAFRKVRFATNTKRGKTYRYWTPTYPPDGWTPGYWGKPPGADALLYQLPYVLDHPDETLWWTEGERDADALHEHGRVATSHHQAAGHATQAQAESLAGHRGWIVLVADRDEAGDVDVVRRYDLLRAASIPARRLRIVKARPRHEGADARDHLEAGFGIEDFRRVDLGRVRAGAERVSAETINSYVADRLTDDELAAFHHSGWMH